MRRVLIIDDDESLCELLASGLASRGFDASFRTAPSAALDALAADHYDAVVTDLRMREMSGIELCDRVLLTHPDVPVVLITAHGDVDAAVAALRVRAFDFLSKPVDVELLASVLARATSRPPAHQARRRSRRNKGADPADGLIGESAPMQALRALMDRVARVDTSVLIGGETGTGKELVARGLHALSARSDGPFVAINCAALPESLLEAELFGYAKGAFTDARTDRSGLFERARGGTLLLDEIGEMQLGLQPKLLRVLQERVVRPVGSDREIPTDVRVIASTNRDLQTAVAAKQFREDLFYRIDVIEIRVPPLRERGCDALLLAAHFVREFSRGTGKSIEGLTPGASEKIASYTWPGNVRELRNCIERAVALTTADRIGLDDFPDRVRRVPSLPETSELSELLPLVEVEHRYIQRVLDAAHGNKSLAARILGVDRRTLYRREEHRHLTKADEPVDLTRPRK